MPRYACACHGRDVECGNGLTTTCANRKQIVVIPTVLKGLNNQRMRIVSDIVGAILIGAAVQLPAKLAARRSCHFRVECYKNYEPVLPIWDVFDEATTLKALKQASAMQHHGARRETTTSPVYIKRARAGFNTCALQSRRRNWNASRPTRASSTARANRCGASALAVAATAACSSCPTR